MCFNKTSINKVVVNKLLKACHESLSNQSGQAYVNNRKGQPFIRVKKVKQINGKVGFQVLDNKNKNIAMLLHDTLIADRVSNSLTTNKYAFDFNNFLLDRVAYPHQIA